jgi:hypothetical protein
MIKIIWMLKVVFKFSLTTMRFSLRASVAINFEIVAYNVATKNIGMFFAEY